MAYSECEQTRIFLRKLMALPYLPHEKIPAAFKNLLLELNSPKLVTLYEYIHYQWITSTVFPLSEWSVLMQCVRTNDNTEGWHSRFSKKAMRPNRH